MNFELSPYKKQLQNIYDSFKDLDENFDFFISKSIDDIIELNIINHDYDGQCYFKLFFPESDFIIRNNLYINLIKKLNISNYKFDNFIISNYYLNDELNQLIRIFIIENNLPINEKIYNFIDLRNICYLDELLFNEYEFIKCPNYLNENYYKIEDYLNEDNSINETNLITLGFNLLDNYNRSHLKDYIRPTKEKNNLIKNLKYVIYILNNDISNFLLYKKHKNIINDNLIKIENLYFININNNNNYYCYYSINKEIDFLNQFEYENGE